jgi:hypothetical protein
MTSTRFDELIGSLRFALDASTPRTTEMPATALDRCTWYAVKLQIARSRTYDAVTEAERLQGEYDALLAALRQMIAAHLPGQPADLVWSAAAHAAAHAAIASTEIQS